nr:venom protein [Lampona murina]
MKTSVTFSLSFATLVLISMVNLTRGDEFVMEQVSEEERGCVTRDNQCSNSQGLRCCSGLRCVCYDRPGADRPRWCKCYE